MIYPNRRLDEAPDLILKERDRSLVEGIDGSGKTFHTDVVQENRVHYNYSVHKVTCPNHRQN